MARNKNLPRKLRLGKSAKKSENVPTWVVIRTKGAMRYTPYSRRNWRNQRLKT